MWKHYGFRVLDRCAGLANRHTGKHCRSKPHLLSRVSLAIPPVPVQPVLRPKLSGEARLSMSVLTATSILAVCMIVMGLVPSPSRLRATHSGLVPGGVALTQRRPTARCCLIDATTQRQLESRDSRPFRPCPQYPSPSMPEPGARCRTTRILRPTRDHALERGTLHP